MKTILSLALLGLSVSVNAADLASPTLLKPDNNANLPLKKAAKFTWQKVTGATKYQLVLSADKQFSGFDTSKYKCINKTTCFTYTGVSPSYQIAASHAILKTDSNYFWQVQAINKTQRSKTSDVRSFSVGTPTPPAIENVSANPQQITLGNSVTLNAVLDKSLPADNSVKISIADSDFQNMTGSDTEFSFIFKPTEIGESQFIISIFDKNGVEIDSLSDSFTTIAKGDVETFVSGDRTFSYTKIANDGSELAKTAKLGTAPKDWACTKDNNTGLIWEVKTDDGGLRDKDNKYTWYNGDPATQNGYDLFCAQYPEDYCKSANPKFFIGSENNGQNTEAYTKAVNAQGLCGSSNWRLPTKSELESLVYCSNGKYKTLGADKYNDICDDNATYPRINKTYFPEDGLYHFWSSSTYDGVAGIAWSITVFNGYSGGGYKNYNINVRLVR